MIHTKDKRKYCIKIVYMKSNKFSLVLTKKCKISFYLKYPTTSFNTIKNNHVYKI